MKYIFVAVYILVLATQLPHVWSAYAALEAPGLPLAHITALGAAVAFELSTGVFTLRVVNGSRKRATRAGIAFFIGCSVVANGYYYGVLPLVFQALWPVIAMVALPASLALFAEEFATEVKRERSEAQRAERKAQRAEAQPEPQPIAIEAPAVEWAFVCPDCGIGKPTQQAMAGHMKAHSNRNGKHKEPIAAMEVIADAR